ncbi:MAG TPA: hypothetical protein DCQ98_05840 [Planctomycetaceae bacterium]|nr:hypothetical protein [Planctomycetaceae bacterium]
MQPIRSRCDQAPPSGIGPFRVRRLGGDSGRRPARSERSSGSGGGAEARNARTTSRNRRVRDDATIR